MLHKKLPIKKAQLLLGLRFLIVILIVGNGLILFQLFHKDLLATFPTLPLVKTQPTATPLPTDYPEVKELSNKFLTYDYLKDYFTKLADKKGAEYAFRVLAIAPLPPNTDLHLLGHVVGDVLFAQQGIEGIKVCTDEFRNACSHSIVVGILLEKGEGVLPEIAPICRQAPGGAGAYTMCYHGLGHGILAYAKYDLPKAVELCKKTGTEKYHQREYIECVGGTIMEIIGGGGHDQKLWAQQRTKYLSTTDPLSPCDKPYMPQEAKSQCYLYLTPQLFEAAGGSIASPNEQTFQKAIQFCKAIPETQRSERDTCFGGFGKEFITLANNRDIRNVDKMTEEQYKTVASWCAFAQDKDGENSCIANALASVFWGGENDKAASYKFCNTTLTDTTKNFCYSSLIGNVQYYIQDKTYRKTFCGEIPSSFQEQCKTQLEVS